MRCGVNSLKCVLQPIAQHFSVTGEENAEYFQALLPVWTKAQNDAKRKRAVDAKNRRRMRCHDHRRRRVNKCDDAINTYM